MHLTGSSMVSEVPRYSGPVRTTVYHWLLLYNGSHVNYMTTDQPMGGAATMSMTLKYLPVSKYSGHDNAEPFEKWLKQFKLVASVCNWEG